MFRLLILFMIIAAGIAGLGFYRGWFHVESDSSADSHRITITTDDEKIKKDKDSLMEHMPGSSQPSKDTAPAGKGN